MIAIGDFALFGGIILKLGQRRNCKALCQPQMIYGQVRPLLIEHLPRVSRLLVGQLQFEGALPNATAVLVVGDLSRFRSKGHLLIDDLAGELRDDFGKLPLKTIGEFAIRSPSQFMRFTVLAARKQIAAGIKGFLGFAVEFLDFGQIFGGSLNLRAEVGNQHRQSPDICKIEPLENLHFLRGQVAIKGIAAFRLEIGWR